jgi:hypothetical protein
VHLVAFTTEIKIIGLYKFYIVMFWSGYRRLYGFNPCWEWHIAQSSRYIRILSRMFLPQTLPITNHTSRSHDPPDFNVNHHSHNKYLILFWCVLRLNIRTEEEKYAWRNPLCIGLVSNGHVAQWKLKLSALLPIENPENKCLLQPYVDRVWTVSWDHTLPLSLHTHTHTHTYTHTYTPLSFHLHFCLVP